MFKRTSPIEVLARFWVVAFILALIPFGLPAVLVGAISLSFLEFIALVVTLLFNGLQWLGHRLVFRALFGDTPEYQRFRASGGDPWFHFNCPPPFNCDSEQVRLIGRVRWFCNHCHAEAFDPEAPCPVCHYEQYECGNCGTLGKDEFAVCPRCGNTPLRQLGTC